MENENKKPKCQIYRFLKIIYINMKGYKAKMKRINLKK